MQRIRFLLIVVLASAAIVSPGNHFARALPATTTAAFISSAATTKFMRVPFLPPCMAVAMKQGDPRRGPSVTLARIDSGCVIPWHWHTSNTRLVFIRGHVLHRTQGQTGFTDLFGGDMIYLPSHHAHWAKCISTCLTYNISDARDVSHWVDANGKDIPLAKALRLATQSK